MVAGSCSPLVISLFARRTLIWHSQFWRSGNSEQATDKDAGVVPEDWLEADIKQGLGNHDIETRRKRFGWNEITTEKENLFIKFLGFFTGPVLYGKSSSFAQASGSFWHCFVAPMASCRLCCCFSRA